MNLNLLLLPWQHLHNIYERLTMYDVYKGIKHCSIVARVDRFTLCFGTMMHGGYVYRISGTSHDAIHDKTKYKNADEAMAACDKQLLKLGYELISLERADKLRLLL